MKKMRYMGAVPFSALAVYFLISTLIGHYVISKNIQFYESSFTVVSINGEAQDDLHAKMYVDPKIKSHNTLNSMGGGRKHESLAFDIHLPNKELKCSYSTFDGYGAGLDGGAKVEITRPKIGMLKIRLEGRSHSSCPPAVITFKDFDNAEIMIAGRNSISLKRDKGLDWLLQAAMKRDYKKKSGLI